MSIIPATHNTTCVLSAELDWRDDGRNFEAHLELRARLARQLEIGELLAVYECRGSYKGSPERSFAITGQANRVRAIAKREAEKFNQESTLQIQPNGHGYLVYTAINHSLADDHIGQYQALGNRLDDIDDIDAWTVILATGETFTFE